MHPCVRCRAFFVWLGSGIESLSRASLFLFLLPAILGVRRGLGIAQIKLSFAVFLALAITILMVPMSSGRGLWALNWALLWPAWYLVAAARQSGNKAGPT